MSWQFLFLVVTGLVNTEASNVSAGYTSYGKCPTADDGSGCLGKHWQHDGVCLHTMNKFQSRNAAAECVSPVPEDHNFTIVAKYLPRSHYSVAVPKRLFIRGSGPGLSWGRSIEMKRLQSDTWTALIQYTSDFNSLLCRTSSHCSLNQGALEFRIYKDETGREEMKGPNFYFPLPVSDTFDYNNIDYRKPAITVYPWFTRETSHHSRFEHTMHSSFLNDSLRVRGNLVFPPSFKDNVYRRYPLIVVLENKTPYIPQLDDLFFHARTVEEAIFLMIRPDQLFSQTKYKNYTILPFDSTDLNCRDYRCRRCQSCWNLQRSTPCDREEFIMRSKRCSGLKKSKGIGELFITDIIHKLAEVIKERSNDRVMYDPPKERLTIIGHEKRAVTAFAMGISRPDLIKNVASLSPKFFLPMTTDYKTKQQIFKYIDNLALLFPRSRPLQALYASQKYYFSHGELDDRQFPLVDTIQVTQTVIRKLKQKFRMKDNVNVALQIVPDDFLDYPNRINDQHLELMSLLEAPMVYFHKASGGPNEKYARTIALSEEFFANRQPDWDTDIAPPVSSAGGGIGINIEDKNVGGKCSSQKTFSVPVFLGSIGMHMLHDV